MIYQSLTFEIVAECIRELHVVCLEDGVRFLGAANIPTRFLCKSMQATDISV